MDADSSSMLQERAEVKIVGTGEQIRRGAIGEALLYVLP
jgi:hypothetical protein